MHSAILKHQTLKILIIWRMKYDLVYFSVNSKMSWRNPKAPIVLTVSGNSHTPALTSGRISVINLQHSSMDVV